MNESELEQTCLQWFQESGWNYTHGRDLSPDSDTSERSDYRQVVLQQRLSDAATHLNPDLPPEAIDNAIRVATTANSPNLITNNHTFHRYLLEGISVEYTNAAGERKSDRVQLIDFQNPDNNDFLVANQFAILGTKQTRYPDIIPFINGLPLAVIELKNPTDENTDIWKAYDQLQTYKNELSDLFVYNQALIISDGFNARVGSLTANQEWFLPWRAIRNENDQPRLEYELEKIARGFFAPDLFLDYIHHFIIFEEDGNQPIKKIAGYHQFHGVREAVRVTLIAAAPPEKDKKGRLREPRATYGREVVRGSRKAGVFWHTQGSGKSISMCCYAGKLIQQPEMRNPTIVVVTDRNDLDGQLYQQFCKAKDLLKQTPEQATSRDELREKLTSRQAGGIVFTTVQKFSLLAGEQKHPVLCDRDNVVVISDEAHRSQYGLQAKLDTKKNQYVYGYAKYMRDALPNASFIGFTGTPISSEDKDTRSVFGHYVSIYDIQDAVDDGATVPIYYESRIAKLDINRTDIDQLNQEVEEILEDEEDLSAREQTKSKWAQLEKLVGAEPRLKVVAEDIVNHFETRTSALEGKAIIVAMSRDICVSLFNEIVALRPEWEGTQLQKNGQTNGYNPQDGTIRIVMTGSASDRAKLQPHLFTKRQKKELENRFKDSEDPLKLVIVRDMWLTGFDAPCCHTMYVDKPMRGHNLMQAIARVNRVFRGKEGGLVVDYIGIAAELKKALKEYTDAKGKGQPTIDAEEALAILQEKMDVLRGMFSGFDYSEYKTKANDLLLPAANHILSLKDGKKRFLDTVTAVTKAYSLCNTLDEATNLREEIAFFTAVRSILVKHTNVDRQRSQAYQNSALKQILDNAIVAEGVADVFSLAGIEKPNISLLSEEFFEEIRHLPTKNLAVELMEKLMRDKIRTRTKTNIIQQKKYSDRLADTLNKYYNRAIETAQVIEELIEMAKEFQESMKRHEELGLNPDEEAFYDALANNESAVRELGDETLKALATELTERLRQNTTIDWKYRDSVRAKLRNLVRRLLRRYKYPPDRQKEAVNLVIEQAEQLSDHWVAQNERQN